MIFDLAKLGDKKISRDIHNTNNTVLTLKSMNLDVLYVKKLIFTLLFFMKPQLESLDQFLP
jgi:hypothetical protein